MWRLVLVTLALAACSKSEAERCLQLVDHEQYGEAAPLCLRVFRVTGRAVVGVAAARALWELERDDEVLMLAAELETSSEAAGARYLRGRIELDRGQTTRGFGELGDLWTDIGDLPRASESFRDAMARRVMTDATQRAAIQLLLNYWIHQHQHPQGGTADWVWLAHDKDSPGKPVVCRDRLR